MNDPRKEMIKVLVFFVALVLILIGFATMFGCESLNIKLPDVKPTPTPIVKPSPTPVLGFGPLVKISWEKYPENRPWSIYVYDLIDAELFEQFNKALDNKRFCPKFDSLKRDEKLTFWTELISAISYFESGWSPVSRMKETTMGTDPITQRPVYSEGLLQLSYQDIQWAPYCRFDWELDKSKADKDPKKTILDPFKNLDCGVRILANQISKRSAIILNSGVYWSVLKEGGKYQQIEKIISMTKKLAFCN